MRNILIAGIVASTLLSAGCASYDRFAGETHAEYILPDGRKLYWKSNKQQQGFKAFVQPNGTIHIEVTEAGSQESVLNAMARANERAFTMMEQVMQKLAPIIEKAAAAGAGS
jgi:hypothetical protein